MAYQMAYCYKHKDLHQRTCNIPSYLLGKGCYVFSSVGSSVCLFVCLWTTLLTKL